MTVTAQSMFSIKAPSQPTDPAWFRAALKVIHRLASERHTFRASDVWPLLDALDVQVHARTSLGNVMNRAKNEGWIEPIQMVKCPRSVRKGGFEMEWRSRLCEPGMAS